MTTLGKVSVETKGAKQPGQNEPMGIVKYPQ